MWGRKNCGWQPPISEGMDTLCTHSMPYKIQLWNSQDTLAMVDNLVVTQTLQDLAEVCAVLFWRGAGNEKIVHVCVYEGKSLQYLIYKTLK